MREGLAAIVLLGASALASGRAIGGPDDAETLESATPAARDWTLQLAVGAAAKRTDSADGTAMSGSLAGLGGLRYGITDRLTWAVPTAAFAYRFGDRGGVEVIPFGGLLSLGTGYSSVEHWLLRAVVGGGVAIRLWSGPATAVNLDAWTNSYARWSSEPIVGGNSRSGPSTWRANLGAGVSHRAGKHVSIHAGLAASSRVIADGDLASDREQLAPRFAVGSVQSIGLRYLPLVELHLSPSWSLDALSSLEYAPVSEVLSAAALAGFTHDW